MLYGVVGREPANDGFVDAWTDAIVPIWKFFVFYEMIN